ncbi:MAG: MFS transporter [Pseudomonadota bacterium]
MATTAAQAGDIEGAGYWFEQMPLTRAHWFAGMVIFITFVIEAWEMLILILSAGAIGDEFGLDAGEIGMLISAIFLGMIPGSLIWGKLSTVLGRRNCLVLSIGLYAIFPVISALAPSYEFLWWTRFFAGVVLSGALVVSFPLFMELLPVNVRGRATVLLSAGWPVGTLVAVGVTALFADMGWRIVLGFSASAALWAMAIYMFVPESAYWLAERGRSKDAADTVSRLAAGAVRPDRIGKTPGLDEEMPFFDIFRGPIFPITLLSTIVNFCFAWGYWGMTSWLPELLSTRGLSAGEGLSFIALSALFMFPGYFAASYFTGRWGRKKVMVIFVAFSTIAGIGFATSANLTQMYVWNFTLSFFSLGAWGIWNTWLGEIYDTATRGPGTAWGIMSQRVANTAAPVAIGFVLAATGFVQTILFISLFLAITFVAAAFLPETEGRRLG